MMARTASKLIGIIERTYPGRVNGEIKRPAPSNRRGSSWHPWRISDPPIGRI